MFFLSAFDRGEMRDGGVSAIMVLSREVFYSEMLALGPQDILLASDCKGQL